MYVCIYIYINFKVKYRKEICFPLIFIFLKDKRLKIYYIVKDLFIYFLFLCFCQQNSTKGFYNYIGMTYTHI